MLLGFQREIIWYCITHKNLEQSSNCCLKVCSNYPFLYSVLKVLEGCKNTFILVKSLARICHSEVKVKWVPQVAMKSLFFYPSTSCCLFWGLLSIRVFRLLKVHGYFLTPYIFRPNILSGFISEYIFIAVGNLYFSDTKLQMWKPL